MVVSFGIGQSCSTFLVSPPPVIGGPKHNKPSKGKGDKSLLIMRIRRLGSFTKRGLIYYFIIDSINFYYASY